jgi:3-hydroxybutyryl-CoA dehydratase
MSGGLEVGAFAEVSRTYAAADIAEFAALSGGGGTPESVPEPLIAALFSYLLGVRLPGPGTNYLKQEMRFLAPAPAGETLTARVEVTRLRPEKALVDLRAECRTASGALVCEGRSLVLARDVGA